MNAYKTKDRQQHVLPEERFAICTEITDTVNSVIRVSSIPEEGDTVYTDGGVALRLTGEIGQGGEGHVYFTDSPFLAKIYIQGKMTERIRSKLRCMLQKRIECDGICYPISGLYNSRHEFVGYLMPQAKGRELQTSVFMPKNLAKYFPGWKKRDQVELALTILEKIKYLHDRNILIGDINPRNILIVSSKEVYIVDTDSFQVEGYPCPVGTVAFTAKEILNRNYDSFLRTKGNENFAVATLLFELMLPGKSPYSHQGGGDQIDNIRNMEFPYAYGKNSTGQAPDGAWKFMWSHLPTYIKEMFYCTFRKNEKFSEEAKRPDVNQWIKNFRRYLNDIDSGDIGGFDAMSLELFPTRTKKWNKDIAVATCEICGTEKIAQYLKNGVCPECLKRLSRAECSNCGSKYEEDIRMILRYWKKGWHRHNLCPDCFNKKAGSICINCHEYFQISKEEYYSILGNRRNFPKRCDICRK